jgi:hypothetical protein
LKKPISLLLIILVTAISWSSCAKNKVINVATIYNLSYPIVPSLLLTPVLTTLENNENLDFFNANVVSEHNRFFELSIIFNERLQQIMSSFSHSNNESSSVVDNSFPSYTSNQSTVKTGFIYYSVKPD